jgi:hypothetical protein
VSYTLFLLSLLSAGLADADVVDLSLLVSPEYPVTWPQSGPLFQMTPALRIGPASAYNTEIIRVRLLWNDGQRV